VQRNISLSTDRGSCGPLKNVRPQTRNTLNENGTYRSAQTSRGASDNRTQERSDSRSRSGEVFDVLA
jgi:hypothetical protein